MAGVRDPAFWKRFSTAVHLDEEQFHGQRPELKHQDSWLARQQRKRSRRACLCWAFWLCFFTFVAVVIVVVIWLLKSGILNKVKLGNGDGVPNEPANPNGSDGAVNAGGANRLARRALERGWR